MPFDDDDDQDNKPRVGLKAPKNKSIFDGIPKKPSKEEADKKASEANDKLNSYRTRAMELAITYKKLLDDKTLVQNKTLINSEIESEVLSSLAQLAIDMNTDENETEGMGSVGLTSLLLRCMLIQRDKINQSDYELHTLNSKVKNLESQLEKVLSLIDTKKSGE